jgi:hypothetical protein
MLLSLFFSFSFFLSFPYLFIFFMFVGTFSLDHERDLEKTLSFVRNPNLGLATKAKAFKVGGQEGSPKVTSHALESAKECEGMNPHTPK